jgi:hypothetical protein
MSIHFHVDADPNPDRDWHQKTLPIHMRILPQNLHMVENKGKKLTFNYNADFNVFLSNNWKRCHDFSILDSMFSAKS